MSQTRVPRPESPPDRPPREPGDPELVERCRQGDEAAYALLVGRHQRQAFGLALRLLRDRALADDVTQDAFVRAFERLHQFNGHATFGTWLGRIVLNRSLDALRRRCADEPARDRADRATRRVAAETIPDLAAGPAGELERREVVARFAEALGTLSPRQRAAFTLRHLERTPTRETARLMGVDESSVKIHLMRAIRKLRAALEPVR